jgi:choline dehydrogenase-like flavoprotein
VTLASSDALKPPLIDPQFLSDDRDLELLVKGFKIMRQIIESPAFSHYGNADMYAEGVTTDAQIEDLIRNRADTVYHPVGTCKMGPDTDPMAVVDSQLHVRGVDQLRVVDASIMPTLVSGNTNAPTIMIAEKASDMILNAA